MFACLCVAILAGRLCLAFGIVRAAKASMAWTGAIGVTQALVGTQIARHEGISVEVLSV